MIGNFVLITKNSIAACELLSQSYTLGHLRLDRVWLNFSVFAK